jgi:hypothetical protein
MLENMQQESTDTANHPAGFCAMKMFQNKDRVGTELLDSVLATTHQNQAGCLLFKYLTSFNKVSSICKTKTLSCSLRTNAIFISGWEP